MIRVWLWYVRGLVPVLLFHYYSDKRFQTRDNFLKKIDKFSSCFVRAIQIIYGNPWTDEIYEPLQEFKNVITSVKSRQGSVLLCRDVATLSQRLRPSTPPPPSHFTPLCRKHSNRVIVSTKSWRTLIGYLLSRHGNCRRPCRGDYRHTMSGRWHSYCPNTHAAGIIAIVHPIVFHAVLLNFIRYTSLNVITNPDESLS